MNYPYPDLFIDIQSAQRRLAKSWGSNGKPIKRSLKRYNRDQSDMSPFSFILTLLLIGTVAATYSNDPAFWLLIGPAPLAAVFTATTVFRRRSGRPAPSPDSALLEKARIQVTSLTGGRKGDFYGSSQSSRRELDMGARSGALP
jgi:hypothetical protein